MSQPTIAPTPAGAPQNGPAETAGENGSSTDPIPARVNGESDPKFFTQEDLDAARKQEKDKMYKRLESMQETVTRLQEESKNLAEAEDAKQREIQQIQQQKEAEEKARLEQEMSLKDLLATKEKEWQAQLEQVQTQVQQERALRERETEFAQLMEYRQQVAQEFSDRIAPELLDLIEGNTPEEITRSAEDLAARTERIVSQATEAMQYARQQTPTARVTSPQSGENSGTQRMPTPEEIRDMSMQEYAKHRRSLLGGGADGPRNRGLFG